MGGWWGGKWKYVRRSLSGTRPLRSLGEKKRRSVNGLKGGEIRVREKKSFSGKIAENTKSRIKAEMP